MMGTLDDRNLPLNTRQSIDDCSGEEWNTAARSFWKHLEEDPKYSKADDLFQGSLFDEADDGEDYYTTDLSETQQMLDDESAFEKVVEVLGPYEAISYCHGMALYALINPIGTTLEQAEVAKLYTARMHRLLVQTKGINW